MPLRDEFAADAADIIADFGEQATYRPFTGQPRTVTCIVQRMPLSTSTQKTGRPVPWMMVTFSTDPNAGGIDPTTFDPDRDRIDLAYQIGRPAATFGFSKDFLIQTPNRLKVRIH